MNNIILALGGILVALVLILAAQNIPVAGTAANDKGAIPSTSEEDCSFSYPPGMLINFLLNVRTEFDYDYKEFPEERRIEWVINGPEDAITALAEHIKQMKCIIESGGNPRAHDPLFVLEAAISRKYINTEIIRESPTTLRVIKTGDNDCAYEVIRLHARVVQGFIERGRAEVMRIHEVPQEVMDLCSPYLE